MVSLKLILLVAAAIGFVAAGGVQFTKNAISEAKSLKNEIIPTTKPKTQRTKSMVNQKLSDKTGGVNA